MRERVKLRRVRPGLYRDDASNSYIEFDGHAWVAVLRGSWVTTTARKRDALAFIREYDRD